MGKNLLKTFAKLTVGGVTKIVAVLYLLFTHHASSTSHQKQVCLKTAMPAHACALELRYETSAAPNLLRIDME